jgi:hypothetical protein
MERRMEWLIDRTGVFWAEKAHPIARWDANCDPVGYAVEELGFVRLRLPNGGMTVIFNPSRVGRKTLIATFYFIASEQRKRIAISYGAKCPGLEIFGTVAEALRRIEELAETHPHPIPTILQRRQLLDLPPAHIAEPVIETLRAWNDAGSQWTPERFANFHKIVPLEDVMLVGNPHGTNRLINHHWGANFDFHGFRWMQIARGKDVEDQPFPEMGQRVARLYRRTIADAKPRLDYMEFALCYAGRSVRSRRHLRLLLPWNEPGGDRYLTVFRFRESSTPTTRVADATINDGSKRQRRVKKSS